MIATLLFGSVQANAALRFGVGDAVAHRSAELVNKAGGGLVGAEAAAALPACGSGSFYTVDPADAASLTGYVPLGNLVPPGHTFPSDHTYIYMNPGTYILRAPGDVTITQIQTSTYLTASPVYSDYSITMFHCRDVGTYFAHVKTLSAFLTSAMGQFSNTSCTDFSGIEQCELYVNIPAAAGTSLGTLLDGGDFGTYDYRTTLAFASPSRHPDQTLHAVCPISYFIPSIENSYRAKLGESNDAILYDGTAPCGTIMYDVANTVSGDWYLPGQPDIPEGPNVALIHDNVRTTWETVSVGSSGPGPAGEEEFIPNSAGFVDRDFAQVTNDGHIYCYDTFRDLFLTTPLNNNLIYLVQLTSPTTLKIEQQSAVSCGAGPWSFTGAAVSFER